MDTTLPEVSPIAPAGRSAHEFARVMTEAMAVRDVSLKWLRDRLEERGQRVSLSTLSYWRSGQRRPEHAASLDAVSEIESLLHLPPGRLRHSIGPSRRPGPTPPTIPFIELAGLPESASELIEQLGFPESDRAMHEQTVHMAVTVDATGNDTLVTTRITLKALTGDVDSYPIGLAGITPGDRASIAWVRGATVGGEHVSDDLGIQAWHLTFDEAPAAGHVVPLEFAIWLPTTTHSYCEYFVTRRVRELLLWVNFDLERLPDAAETYDSVGGGQARSLGVVESLFVVHHNYGPGTAGIRWTWPD